MKRSVRNIALVSVLVCALQGVAQQLPQYTQYMLNDFVMNPAVAGRNNYWEAKSNNRYQWVGITDAPRTYMLSLQGPFKNLKMGMGGTLFTDIVGPTRRTGLNLAYAYHLKLNADYKLSFGINAGILQYAVDGSKIYPHDVGDPILSPNYQSALAPDIGAGVYFYSSKFYVSLGFPQIYTANLKFFTYQTTKNSTLAIHFYGLTGYKWQINNDFMLEPTALVKMVDPVQYHIPVKVDLGAKLTFQNKVWIGANYRTKDAVTALIGYMFNNWLMFGYSYDYSITHLRGYNSGTHEVMLGLRFMPPKKKEPK